MNDEDRPNKFCLDIVACRKTEIAKNLWAEVDTKNGYLLVTRGTTLRLDHDEIISLMKYFRNAKRAIAHANRRD